jgi:hypothetical protein
MEKRFLLLTTKKGTPIIIGVSNIATIEPLKSHEGTTITLNFARNSDLWPKTETVTESFEEIKALIAGLTVN